MDTYQAVYDAVRSKMSNGDIGCAVESAMRDANFSHYAQQVASCYMDSAHEQQRPSVLFRPAISIDGDQWCAIYGKNLQEGIAGFGDTPEKAMFDFDEQWRTFSAGKTQ